MRGGSVKGLISSISNYVNKAFFVGAPEYRTSTYSCHVLIPCLADATNTVCCGAFWSTACDYLPRLGSLLIQSSCWAVIPAAAALVADSAVADLITYSDCAVFVILFQFLGSMSLAVSIDAEIGCGHPLCCSETGPSPYPMHIPLQLFEFVGGSS